MKTFLFSIFMLFGLFSIFANNSGELVDFQMNGLSSDPKIELIQFHSTKRCVSCTNMQAFAEETADKFDHLTFKSIDVDKSENAEISRHFQVAGTALFLYHPESGNMEDLTSFGFMNVRNKDKFIEGLSGKINAFTSKN
ncbi:MAG: hypothetical protein EA362_10735 [Saprospirales bacterium]|nr:MAG: hypothetical protein EA362_10735 [Saprospirales bacterium]